jgi:polyphenol oxidase
MSLHQVNDLSVITYSNLDKFKNLVHGSCLRYGGVSEGPYSSLNTSFDVGDTNQHVTENRHRIAQAFGIPPILSVKQVHGLRILDIDETDLNLITQEADALITQKPHKPISILHADCQGTIFYDPVVNVLCTAHAGWRGQSKYFYSIIVQTLCQKYGCKPKNIYVSISPSLGPTYARFDLSQDPLSELQIQAQASENTFDLWQAARTELVNAGIPNEHIECANICTFTSPACFSYRRDKVTGRLMTFAMLKVAS